MLFVDAGLQGFDGIQTLCLGFFQTLQGRVQACLGGFPLALQSLWAVWIALVRAIGRRSAGLFFQGFLFGCNVFCQCLHLGLGFLQCRGEGIDLGLHAFVASFYRLLGLGELFLGLGNGSLRCRQLLLQFLQFWTGGRCCGCSCSRFGSGRSSIASGSSGFFLGCGLGGSVGTSFTLGFFFCNFAFLSSQSTLVAFLGLLGFRLGGTFFTDGALGVAIVLHQRNLAWAYVGTGTTLNAVEQVVLFSLVEFFSAAEPVQLLWQQLSRAGLGAHAAADTGHGGVVQRHFFFSGRQQTVGGFHHRQFGVGQGKAHHRATHHNPFALL